jgi:malonyl-CoA/methylmalonyl-CoA synthetase
VTGGDRVAVQVDKSVDAVLLYLACLRIGAVFVPINVANTAAEVEYFWRDSRPRLAVFRPADAGLLTPLAERVQVPAVDTLGAGGDGSFADRVRALDGRKASDLPRRSWGAGTPAALVYTSGTTGRSKGAILTRGNLGSNARTLAQAWRFTADDVLLHTLPLFHVHGLFAAINTVLASGSSLVLAPKFDAAEVLRRFAVTTVYMGVPTHYTRLLQEPGLDAAATAAVRLFVSGSAPLLAETHREFHRRTGHLILERYGMTETLMNCSNPYDGARVPGSVGPPLPGIEVRVSRKAAAAGSGTVTPGDNPVEVGGDPTAVGGPTAVGDSATAVGDSAAAVGAVGELEIRGPNVFAGYWGDDEKTRAAFTDDGWFKTGDVGRIDADGFVSIIGRAKDLVISGGYNVYPREVEAELDAQSGVIESAVFGVPHPDFGEGVTAAVVAAPGAALTEAGLIDAVRPRLAGYKIPKRILFLDELPRNAMGKVQKNSLRAAYADLYRAA